MESIFEIDLKSGEIEEGHTWGHVYKKINVTRLPLLSSSKRSENAYIGCAIFLRHTENDWSNLRKGGLGMP